MQTTDSYREGWRSYPRSRSRCSSPRAERCSPPERCPAGPTPGGPDEGTILRFSRSSLNLASIFRSSWYPKCIYTANRSKQQERKRRKPLHELYHQNGPQDDGQNLTRTNRHRKRRRRVASDVPRLPRYPWVVAILSGNKGNPQEAHRQTSPKHTSLSAFSLLSASMAAISRIDSSTFPCSPESGSVR